MASAQTGNVASGGIPRRSLFEFSKHACQDYIAAVTNNRK